MDALKCCLTVLLCSAAVVAPARAQDAAIAGTVIDPSNAVVTGATVELVDLHTRRLVASGTSDSRGAYALGAPPGRYELHVTLGGFADYRREVTVGSMGQEREDVILSIAGVTERTSATAAAPARPTPADVSIASTALPASVTVLDHADLERTNIAQDVGTMFRRVPGALAHNIDQGETGTAIKLRGFSSSTHGADTAVYIDGIPQNVPSAAINHGMNDMSWLTPDMIDRIEVVKGPFSALYGDQNRAGAVNIITRTTASRNIAATFGSFGNKHLSAAYSGTVASAQALIVGDLFGITGYRDNARDTRGSIFGKVTKVRGASQFAIRGTFYKADWDAPGFLNVQSVASGTLQPTAADPTAPPLWGNGQRTSVVFTRVPARGEAGLHVSMATEKYARTRALGANRTDYNVQMDDRWILQAHAVENVLFGARGGIAIGAEYRGDNGDSINQRWPNGTPGPNYSWNQDLNLRAFGAFAQAQVKPIDAVKLIGGLRFDQFDYDINNRKLPAASVHYTEGVATPRGGVVVTPVKSLDLFANIGQGFRSPNQTEISPSGSLGPLGAPGGTPYPTLAVPKVRSYDFGATVTLAERWTATIAGFHTFNGNEIVQTAPGVFEAVGDTVRNGWEVDTRITASASTLIYGSVTEITKAQINNPPPNTAAQFLVPAHMVKAGVAHTVPFSKSHLLLNADGYYMSGIPYFTGTPLLIRDVTKPYARYDVRGTLEVGRIGYTLYGTFQPIALGSEPISVIATGLYYDPRPKVEFGVTLRYRY